MRVSLEAMRIHRKMTQEYVANALNVNKKTVSRWENGVTKPDVNMVEPICSLYNCSYDDIEWTA